MTTKMDRRYIDHGLVPCPVRGHDVGFDVCAGCEWATEIKDQASQPFVRCDPAASAMPRYESLFTIS